MAWHKNARLTRKRIAPHDRRIQRSLTWLQSHGIPAHLNDGRLVMDQPEKAE